MVKNTSYIKLKQIQNDLKRNYLKTAALVLLIFMVSKKSDRNAAQLFIL